MRNKIKCKKEILALRPCQRNDEGNITFGLQNKLEFANRERKNYNLSYLLRNINN